MQHMHIYFGTRKQAAVLKNATVWMMLADDASNNQRNNYYVGRRTEEPTKSSYKGLVFLLDAMECVIRGDACLLHRKKEACEKKLQCICISFLLYFTSR